MVHNTKQQRVGDIGEEIASAVLERHNYRIITRNYRKKWGEIDIVAQKGSTLRFVEVKTISRENNNVHTYDPLENVHEQKLARIRRTAESYVIEHGYEGVWGVDVIAIVLDFATMQAHCDILHDVL